jgi:WD40 repeat protein
VKSVLLGHAAPVGAVRFAPDGRTLASGCAGGLVKLWDLSEGQVRERSVRRMHSNFVLCLAFSPDGLILASGGEGDGIKLWDIEMGRERTTFRTGNQSIQAVEFSRDGDSLIAAARPGLIQLWDVATGRKRVIPREHTGSYCTAISPEGGLVASGGADAMVRVWDLAPSLTAELGEESERRVPIR